MDDAQLVAVWLHGRPETTRRAYGREIRKLQAAIARPIGTAELADLQRHAATLSNLAPRSQALAVAAIKSFFAFHAKVGTLPVNPALSLAEPNVPNDLAQRILSEADNQLLIAGAPIGRERIMVRLLYTAGLRASELCQLLWRHLVPRGDGQGQLTVHGKGGKTRTVLLPADLYGDLAVLEPDDAGPNDPIFPSEQDLARPIGYRQLLRVIKRAAAAAGLSDKISCHWMRHAHASHALDAGAPITLVRDTLGHASIATTNKYAHARPNDGSARFLPKS
jgi:integrase/recombinase XerD